MGTFSSAATNPAEINWKRNLFVVWLGQIIAHCAHSFALPFIPLYMRWRFHLDDEAERGLYIAAFEFFGMLTFCISNPLWGALGDRYGRKLMLLRTYFLNGMCIPLMIVAPSPAWLVSVRALASCFSGTISASQALVVATTPEKYHGFALGALSAALWSGTVFGLLGGGLVVHFYGYQKAFLTCGGLLFLSGLITLLFARENFVRQPAREKVRNAETARGDKIFNASIALLLLLLCLLSMARRMDVPFLPVLVEVISGTTNAELYTSYISALAAVGGIVSGLLFGALSDRYPAWKVALPALAAAGAAMLFQACSTSLWTLAAFRFLSFFAAGGLDPVIISRLSKSTASEHRGEVLGWSASIRVLGILLGAGINAAIVSMINTRGVFAAAGIVMLLLIPMCMVILRPRNQAR